MKINNKFNFLIETLLVLWFFVVYFSYIYFHPNPLSFVPIFFSGLFLLALWYFLIKPLKYEFNLKINKPLWQACLFLLISIIGIAVFIRLLGNIFTENLNFIPFLSTELSVVKNILIKILFLSGLILLLASVGKKIFDILKFKIENKKEEFVFSFGLGFLTINYFAFFLTALSWLYFWPSLILIIAFVIFSWTQIKYFFNNFIKAGFKFNISANFQDVENLQSWIWMIVSLFFVITFLFTFRLFPHGADDIVAYFNIPQLYAYYHHLVPFYNTPGAIPAGIGTTFYALINILFAPHFVFPLAWLFLIFLLGSVYMFANKFFSKKVALITLLLSVFVPWNYFFITTQKVIFIFAFISALALFAFFIWLNNKKTKWLYLSAVFLGYAASLKMNGLFLILSLSTLVFGFFVFKKINFKKNAIFGMLIVLFFLPMLVFNISFYSNPMTLFKTFYSKQTNESLFKQNELVTLYDIYQKTNFAQKRCEELTFSGYQNHASSNSAIINFFWRIWNITTNQKGYKNINIEISPYLLIFLPFFILYFIKNKYYKEKNILYLSVISLIFFILWYLCGGERPWYGIAIFYFLFIFCALILRQIKNKIHIFVMWFFVVIFCFSILLTLIKIISILPNTIYFSTEHYKKNYYNSLEFKIYNFVNKEIIAKDDQALILTFLESKNSYIDGNDKKIISDKLSVYWGKIVQETESLEEIKNILTDQGITHIVYSARRLKIFLPPKENQKNRSIKKNFIKEMEIFTKFRNKYLIKLYCEAEQSCVYQIKK